MESPPWELLNEAEKILTNHLARTGSMEDDLLHVLVRLRLVLDGYEITVAQAEIAEYQPPLH